MVAAELNAKTCLHRSPNVAATCSVILFRKVNLRYLDVLLVHHEVSLGCCSRNPASSLVRGISAPHEVLSPLPVVTHQRRLLHIDMRRRNDDYGMPDSGWLTTAAHMPEDDFLDCEKNRQLIDTLVRWCCAYYQILS